MLLVRCVRRLWPQIARAGFLRTRSRRVHFVKSVRRQPKPYPNTAQEDRFHRLRTYCHSRSTIGPTTSPTTAISTFCNRRAARPRTWRNCSRIPCTARGRAFQRAYACSSADVRAWESDPNVLGLVGHVVDDDEIGTVAVALNFVDNLGQSLIVREAYRPFRSGVSALFLRVDERRVVARKLVTAVFGAESGGVELLQL